jgi:hypothetical protein
MLARGSASGRVDDGNGAQNQTPPLDQPSFQSSLPTLYSNLLTEQMSHCCSVDAPGGGE